MTVFGACGVVASDVGSIVAFSFSLRSESATVAYQLFADEDGLLSRIVRYEAESEIRDPQADDLQNGRYSRTDEFTVISEEQTVRIVRTGGAGEQPGISLVRSSGRIVRLLIDGASPIEAEIEFDPEVERAAVTYRGRQVNAFGYSGATTIVTIPNQEISYTYAGEKLESMVIAFKSSGDMEQVQTQRDGSERYELVMPSGGDPVPFLRKLVAYGQPRKATFRSLVYNFYLLDVLDDGDESYVLPFFGSPIDR